MFARGFLGVVPATLVGAIIRLCRPDEWKEVFVACSGTFRTERGLAGRFPDLVVRSNDVSLFSTALGRLATTEPLDFTFKGDLAFIENLGLQDPRDRMAAILVALDYSAFLRGKANRFKVAHAAHYREHFWDLVQATRPKLDKVLHQMRITSYFGGDFRDHIAEAIERGAGVIAYPPTFRGGYEKLFEVLHANVDWQPPPYRMFDPKDIGEVVRGLENSASPYFVYCDQPVDGLDPVIRLDQAGKRVIYGYGRAKETSFRVRRYGGKPFAYRPIDLTRLGPATEVRIVKATGAQVDFLRSTYLQKSIQFASGDYQALVFLDDMLAGAIIYQRSTFAFTPETADQLYLLSDFATTRAGRLAKLIARIATLRSVIRPFERATLEHFDRLLTTAFSDHPEAMKYRGSWKVINRRENPDGTSRYLINYGSPVRDESPQQAYEWWWNRDGEAQVAAARDGTKAHRSPAPEAA
ncbi:V-type ATPase 116kDa subunit family protein [Chelatococcus asaccharovorans]|uniref:Uncharacterized protein n=1 Tax=Chelatococcus asaccharovorans TaxID=28210 RepID=A0A2V3UBP5_9HYPH|nr:V-type ATPase 116kDa subunit family protein [Chelatococcus asaccharovorans]MBS7703297.1 hypothetical protein [Chelatococcus asaccharovorans]PXW61631.1 hypothetical protein C7450_103148 [Chelatococcus asaccharovorans]